jgi:hypothetical protein
VGRYVMTEEELARGRQLGAPLGGQAVKGKRPPNPCPCCGRDTSQYTYHQWLGHRGLNEAAKRKGLTPEEFLKNGLTLQDPFPENGAYQQWRQNEHS